MEAYIDPVVELPGVFKQLRAQDVPVIDKPILRPIWIGRHGWALAPHVDVPAQVRIRFAGRRVEPFGEGRVVEFQAGSNSAVISFLAIEKQLCHIRNS